MIPVDDTGHETDLETIVIVTTTILFIFGIDYQIYHIICHEPETGGTDLP